MRKLLQIIKNNKIKTVIICITILLIIIGVSYAFFYVSTSGNTKNVTFGYVSINYVDGNKINMNNNLPMTENEVDRYAPKKSFSITNKGNIAAYLEISLTSITLPDALNDENFRWSLYEDNTRIADGNFLNASSKLTLIEGISVASNKTKNYSIAFWIYDNQGNQNAMLNQTLQAQITVTLMDKSQIVDFGHTNSIQTYIVPRNGKYKIEAEGAEGTRGNMFSYTGTTLPVGGKGAYLSSEFTLSENDELTIVVGGQGNVTQAKQKDGTSGAGGGGSFVFKKIDSKTDSRYQFTKNGINYETLLVAAGGGGSNDTSYQNSISNGLDGIGATWYSPSNFVAYSTTTANYTSSSVLGINQFITYNSKGGTYTKSGVCTGGFGGGGCTDTSRSSGGGWSGTTQATSFSSGNNTTGKTGFNKGSGSVKITYIGQ